MRGFQPKSKSTAKCMANGGIVQPRGFVRGPGTGTSDSIKTALPVGTYIMPADSTKMIGKNNLQSMGGEQAEEQAEGAANNPAEEAAEHPGGQLMPVNLSNGEFKIPPGQVHAIGVQMLNQVKDATHTPVTNQRDGEQAMYFAQGGQVNGQNLPVVPMAAPRGFVGRAGGGNIGKGATANSAAPRGFVGRLSGAPSAPSAPKPAAQGAASGGAVRGFTPRRMADGGGVEDQYGYLPGESIVDRLARKLTPSGGGAPLELGAPNSVGMPTKPAGSGRGFINPSVASPDQSATASPVSPAPPISQDPQTDVQRGGGSAPAIADATPAASPPTSGLPKPRGFSPNVTKTTGSDGSVTYSGSNIGGDITVNGNAPDGGFAAVNAPRGFTPNSMPAAVENPKVAVTSNLHPLYQLICLGASGLSSGSVVSGMLSLLPHCSRAP